MKPRSSRNLILQCSIVLAATLGFALPALRRSSPPAETAPGNSPATLVDKGHVQRSIVSAKAPLPDPSEQAPRTRVALSAGDGGSISSKKLLGSAARAGMIVGIDPESGDIGPPTPEQARELASAAGEAVSRPADGVLEIRRPDGAVGLDLQGRFQDYATVRLGPDGRPVFGCIHADGPVSKCRMDSLAAPSMPEEE